jgi:CRP/FNR family transcriptional regulator, cyclic AMP receptor protein
MAGATTITSTTVLIIAKSEMTRVLHAEHEFSDRFIAYMLARNIRIGADLVDQLFNSTENAWPPLYCCSPLRGARPARQAAPQSISGHAGGNDWLNADPVNLFMNKFRKLGLIEYNSGLKVEKSLLSVVLHE